MEKKDKKPVTFRIEPPIVKKLKFLAVELDRTVTDLLLEAIRDLLKKYEKKTRRDEHGKPSS
jgi:predicted transcriptional regulator